MEQRKRLWLRQVITLVCVTGLGACASEPSSSEDRSGQEPRKFSDDRFLCDADNLALWDRLERDGVDVRGMGLTCTSGDGANAIRVSDSFVPTGGEGSADAIPNSNSSSGNTGSNAEDQDGDAAGDDPDDSVVDNDDPPPADADDTPPDTPDDDPAVTFSANLAPLIDADCVSCHSGQFPPRLDSYANVAAAGQASLNAVLTNDMPPGNGWSPTDKELFQAWADAGFPE